MYEHIIFTVKFQLLIILKTVYVCAIKLQVFPQFFFFLQTHSHILRHSDYMGKICNMIFFSESGRLVNVSPTLPFDASVNVGKVLSPKVTLLSFGFATCYWKGY